MVTGPPCPCRCKLHLVCNFGGDNGPLVQSPPTAGVAHAWDIKQLEISRKKLNSYLGRVVRNVSGAVIAHPQIAFNCPALFRPNGVHLTDVGTDFFVGELATGSAECDFHLERCGSSSRLIPPGGRYRAGFRELDAGVHHGVVRCRGNRLAHAGLPSCVR